MKISLSETKFFDREAFNGNLYVGKDDGKGFNALLVTCLIRHYKTRLKGAWRAYLVLEGTGTFTTNGMTETASPFDFFLVGDGDEYEYEGALKLFEFNVPATDSNNEEKLD